VPRKDFDCGTALVAQRVWQSRETSQSGDNVSLITGSINIKKLREFQKLNYTLQEGNKNFKFTPPNFKMFERDK
jgi:hypothetical protein